ncbi:TadE/TadG family type IV pilus assembly protein [Mangrovicella endophytica]|uniref:TadE/TadG family type IV pilus assembly protein n=1 Tax=Mangrovicella endophytica TaxID=2066697 RepID=UPI000C9E2AB0|nr:TadE/TadG family type IV pilus assembly protein [Mangrovicella endophytica]
MIRYMRARLRRATAAAWRFRKDRRGIAAVEFAVVAPVMLFLSVATIEVSKYYQADNQVVQVANMIGQMVSQLPDEVDASEVQKIWKASPLIAPEAFRTAKQLSLADWNSALAVTITNVAFTQKVPSCTSACEYVANVAWSIGDDPMACGQLIKTSNATPPTQGLVPEVLFMPGSAIFVTAKLRYKPHLGTDFFTSDAISEAAWFRPRNTTLIRVTPSIIAAPTVVRCTDFN